MCSRISSLFVLALASLAFSDSANISHVRALEPSVNVEQEPPHSCVTSELPVSIRRIMKRGAYKQNLFVPM